MSFVINPCPCCGERSPFTYISSSCVVLRCSCGLEVGSDKGAARIMYPRKEVPPELVPHQYEFSEKSPWIEEEDYVAINALAALDHSGALAIWNRRV